MTGTNDFILSKLKEISNEQAVNVSFRKYIRYNDTLYYPDTPELRIDEKTWTAAIRAAKLPLRIVLNKNNDTFSHARGEVTPPLYFQLVEGTHETSRSRLALKTLVCATVCVLAFSVAYIKTPV
jgi:hypothetical protein